MDEEAVLHQAVLVVFGRHTFDADELRGDVETAFRATGQAPIGDPAECDDPLTVVGRTLMAQLDVFADARRGGSVPEDEVKEGIEVFADAYPDLPRPDALISVRLVAHAPDTDGTPDTTSAVLAQMLHLLVDRTYAHFVRLPGRSGLMTGERFQTEFRLVSPPTVLIGAGNSEDDASVDARFPDIEETGDRLEAEWLRLDPPEPDARRFWQDIVEDRPQLPIEARLATWAVNGTVAIFSPPVGASLAVYNVLRGEDFRLNTHALTLTSVFLTLAAAGAPGPFM
ncbi:hypothetical protein [Rhodosalinus sp. FB01]|uniref:hypothetical protein n=1 Tax=Rhodosalinus sp. FB01 TaxID=3239194 RepID=UPI003524B199